MEGPGLWQYSKYLGNKQTLTRYTFVQKGLFMALFFGYWKAPLKWSDNLFILQFSETPSLTCSICASILDSLSKSFYPCAASKAICIALQILFLRSNKLRIFAFLVPLQLWSSELQYVRRGCVLPPPGLSKPLSYSSQSSCKEEAVQTQNICENKMCVYIMALKIFVIILT